MTKIIGIVFRLGFLILLIILFVFMFGLPSWKKYQHVGISLEHSVEVSDEGNSFPSLTFCPYKRNPRTAWRNGTATLANPFSILPTECNVTSADETIECISSKTYDRKEVIRAVDIIKHIPGNTGQHWTTLNSSGNDWSSRYEGGALGVCHTLHYPHPVGTNSLTDSVTVKIIPDVAYDIFIHDPHFFFPTINPSTFPFSKIKLKEKDTFKVFYIDVTHHLKLNTARSPCGSEFNDCIRKYILREIGCAIVGSGEEDGLCTSMDQIKQLDNLLTRFSMATRRELVGETSCLPPCRQYQSPC